MHTVKLAAATRRPLPNRGTSHERSVPMKLRTLALALALLALALAACVDTVGTRSVDPDDMDASAEPGRFDGAPDSNADGGSLDAMVDANIGDAAPDACAETSCMPCPTGYIREGAKCVMPAMRVSSGGKHACAIGQDGSLWCWGSNDTGELGLGKDKAGKNQPPTRVGAEVGWTEVAAGWEHTCGIREGKLFCWGRNDQGQLGIGSNADSPTPMAVGGSDWFGLSTQSSSACALRGTQGIGQLYCWGYDVDTERNAPTLVGGSDALWKAVTVSPSGSFACAIRNTGALFCWGNSEYGRLGLGDTALATVVKQPTQVGSERDWTAVRAGNISSCGLRAGRLLCWGTTRGLWSTETSRETTPKQYGSWDDWVNLSSGCGIRKDGSLWCWGGNTTGVAGQAPTASGADLPPTRVGSEVGWSDVSSSAGSACAVRAQRAMCWGSNIGGTLGTTDSLPYVVPTPTRVGTANDWLSVAAGWWSTCGLRGTLLHCWGYRSDVDKLVGVPEQIGADSGWRAVTQGRLGAALGIRGNGIFFWGKDEGYSPRVAAPTSAVSTAGLWSAISHGGNKDAQTSSTCALQGTSLYCWGDNGSGQLGVGDTAARTEPTQVAGTWRAVAQNGSTTYGVSTAGELFGWGSLSQGNVAATPARIGSLSGWSKISAGYYGAACGICSGQLHCVDQTRTDFRRVGTYSDWQEVAAAMSSSYCAIRQGALYCWGNGSPILGLPSFGRGTQVTSPTLVDDGAASPWQGVSLGLFHGCAVRGDGSLWCWGNNDHGEVGVGTSWTHEPRIVEMTDP
jgi:alpha-tubulin suppressor-like RCC1 family protein